MKVFTSIVLVALCQSVWAADAVRFVSASRLSGNPIIRPEMLPGKDGANINGPSLIRAPSWLTNRLGTYYLYFAHHNGKYIWLAYADRLEGPWKVHEPGTLQLNEAPGCTGHIASPDVHVDNARRELRMYFHGAAKAGGGHKPFVAVSKDGLRFTAGKEVLGQSEMILRSRIQLTADWKTWTASAPEEVLRPETDDEGAKLPRKPSVAGAMNGRERALRDPGIFVDSDGRAYLVYSVASESGLGIAELRSKP